MNPDFITNPCLWCNLPFLEGEEKTIDHIIPITRGGPDRIENLQVLHRKCNSAKGTKIVAHPQKIVSIYPLVKPP